MTGPKYLESNESGCGCSRKNSPSISFRQPSHSGSGRRRTRIEHHRSHKDLRPGINEGEGVTQRTTAHDFVSRLDRPRRRRVRSRRNELAISMSEMTDRSAPIYASPVKGDGDDSFTLI
jgi:hypothetical protein